MTVGNKRIARDVVVDWSKFNVDDYLLTHCSIVCSVEVEDNGYHIVPPCEELVNANGNAWSTPVLISTFKTFIGAENFIEHVQIPELSKGKILDAILRPVVYEGKSGAKANVLYCDILVATDRKYIDLIDSIESGKLDTLSMGCIAHVVQCSQCGREIDDSMKNCIHLDHKMFQTFVDESGVERIVAELCGKSYIDQTTGKRVGDPNSVTFIEASWVDKPAFKGAVINHFISQVDRAVQDKKVATLQEVVNDIFKLRVADTEGAMALRVARVEVLELRRLELLDRVMEVV